jgi:hypothetical protein
MIQYVDHSVVYYGLQSSSSYKEPDDAVCRSQYYGLQSKKSLMMQCVDDSVVYYGLQSSSSYKEPDDAVCRWQCGVLWFTVK